MITHPWIWNLKKVRAHLQQKKQKQMRMLTIVGLELARIVYIELYIYGVYTTFLQGNHRIYGNIRCVYIYDSGQP